MKTSNSVLSAVVVSVLGLSAALNAPQALAVDDKIYPGYMCKQYAGTGWVQTGYSSIYNGAVLSGQSVFLDCPVIRDTSGTINGGWVQVTDNNDGENIVCRLFTATPASDSSMLFFFSEVSTSGKNPGPQFKSFASPSSLGANAHYFVDCRIPPRQNGGTSLLHTYKVVEN